MLVILAFSALTVAIWQGTARLPLYWIGTSGLTADDAVSRAAKAFRNNQLDLAGAYLLVAVKSDPGHARAHYMLAQAYESAGRSREAIDTYRKVAGLTPEDPSPRYNLAMLLTRVGEPEQALLEAEAALSAGMPAARHAVALAYQRLNRLDESAAAYRRLLADRGRLTIDWAEVLLQFGDVEWGRGRIEEARALWQEAETLHPRHAGVRERLARAP